MDRLRTPALALIEQVHHVIMGHAVKQVDLADAMKNLGESALALAAALKIVDPAEMRIAELEDALRPFAAFSTHSDAAHVAGARKLDPGAEGMADATIASIMDPDHAIKATTGEQGLAALKLTTAHFRKAASTLAGDVPRASTMPAKWPNGCNETVPQALRYLADHDRPQGGEQHFNSAHLYQLASEIEAMARQPLLIALPTTEEKRAQAMRCACRGSDDYCVCQNVPDKATLAERKARA